MGIKKEEKILSSLYEDLNLLESYARELFSFSPLPLSFISPSGVILEANPAFEKISNYSLNEIIGNLIFEFFEKEKIRKVIEETLKKGSIEGEEIEFFSKEAVKICQVFTKARKDEKGQTIGFFLGFFDLTEIKKTEEELKKSQKALLNILEDTEEARRVAEEEKNKTLTIIQNLMDGLLVFDNEGKLSLINPQAERFLGFPARDLIGQSVLELATLPSFQPLMEILKKELRSLFKKEIVISEDLVLEISSIPLISGEEKLGTLIILHDVTREKVIERLKTEFVSLSAHQLRTPLSAIKWTLKMFLDGDLGPLTKEQREFIEKTYNSNEKMISLVNDLLSVTRIEEGRYLYKPILFDLESLVQSSISTYKGEVERKKIKLIFKKPKEKLPPILLDTEKMKLAIDNLLENAVRYNLVGGKIIISLKRKEKEIEFSIKDTGIGIPKEEQQRVFTKFFRGSNALRVETEGTGLGLFITKNIIEAHGGKIWFESEEGKGTTFYFTLPFKDKI